MKSPALALALFTLLTADASQRYVFRSTVANVEYASRPLHSEPPDRVRATPGPSSGIWFGSITRRLPGDAPGEDGHSAPFAAEYRAGEPVRAWCDANLNGDLGDDPAVALSAYPPIDGARSFLTDLNWSTRYDNREIAVSWKVRVVLEPETGTARGPGYRVQRVYAKTGTVTLEGTSHQAFLFDGNSDGLYTRSFMDGVFIDTDRDGRFETDLMSPEFAPFTVPFQMGARVYEIESVDPEGEHVALRTLREVEPAPVPRLGDNAPEFSFRDLEGRDVRLVDYRGRPVIVYFWASWCSACEAQSAAIAEIYRRFQPAGLEILGVSYDTDRAAMASFREKHGYTWPTSFSGRMFWEDRIGRLYRAKAAGRVYLVDAEGRLEGVYDDTAELTEQLAVMLGPQTAPTTNVNR